ncbi:MAG TPA: hypothetical protein VIL29_10480 [Pseudothermotoga sp.]
MSKKSLLLYLERLVNDIFKILPLYEEKAETLPQYIDSLIYELQGFQELFVKIGTSPEFVTMLCIMERIAEDSIAYGQDKAVIKREVFKMISLIKKIIEKCDEK